MRHIRRIPLVIALFAYLLFILVAVRQYHAAPAPVLKEKVVAFDDTALSKLAKLLPPPEKLTHPGGAAKWRAAEKELGSALPEEYKRFVSLYGMIGVNGCIGFHNPFVSDMERNGLQPNLKVVREGEKFRSGLELEYQAVWPEEGGLLPIASTITGHYLAYRTKGKPDGWTVVVLTRASEVEDYPYGLVEFMTRLAEGKLGSSRLLQTGDLRPPLTIP